MFDFVLQKKSFYERIESASFKFVIFTLGFSRYIFVKIPIVIEQIRFYWNIDGEKNIL